MASVTAAAPPPAIAQCRDLSAPPLSRKEAEDLAQVLKALADPRRLQILSVLRSAPDHTACAGEFARPLNVSGPTVSHHLKVLHEAGILERERRGPWIYYRLPDERLAQICAVLL